MFDCKCIKSTSRDRLRSGSGRYKILSFNQFNILKYVNIVNIALQNITQLKFMQCAYNTTRCYSTHCGGFLQTSITIALEAAITRTYTFEGPQFEITIQISKVE